MMPAKTALVCLEFKQHEQAPQLRVDHSRWLRARAISLSDEPGRPGNAGNPSFPDEVKPEQAMIVIARLKIAGFCDFMLPP
jgi:hypothetical protein